MAEIMGDLQGFRVSLEDLVARFRLSELFSGLDNATLYRLACSVEWVVLPARGILFRQGDSVDGAYLVITGRLRIFVEGENGSEEPVAEIGRNEFIGELGILTGERRSATVHAVRETVLVKLTSENCTQIVATNPRFMLQIARSLAQRLAARNRPHRHSPLGTIAVVPTSPHVPLSELSCRLSSILGTVGETLHLTSRGFDQICDQEEVRRSPKPASPATVEDWLSEKESQCRFILYEADSDDSPWTRRCLASADHVLLVGQGDGDPRLGQIEEAHFKDATELGSAQKTLILIHSNGRRPPVATREWLSTRKVDQHFHVRWDSKRDFERLVRFLSGQAVGLVLGGGGARGFAHIGVIRALQEAKIEFDFIGGTSMGSLIAAEYALGLNWDAMVAANKEIFSWRVFDVTLPLSSLIAGRRGRKMLIQHLGMVNIEDLWDPYFCISSNLTRAEIMLHRQGLLWLAVRASGSFPGIAPAVVADHGDLLVDGGLLNNLPVDLMYRISGHGKVIAVDAGVSVELSMGRLGYSDSLSGWRVLGSKFGFFGRETRIPTIAYLMMRAGHLASVHSQRKLKSETHADLYLRPPVADFGLLDFVSIEAIVERGYQYARQQIAEWQTHQHHQPLPDG